MNAPFRHLGWSLVATFALVGCESAPTPPPAPTAPTPPPSSTAPADSKDKAATAEPKLSEEEVAEIKKLPAAEQSIAMAQMICPVSGSHLGSMDKPLKQTIDGKDFYICCSGCEDKVKEEPAAVLAKLKK